MKRLALAPTVLVTLVAVGRGRVFGLLEGIQSTESTSVASLCGFLSRVSAAIRCVIARPGRWVMVATAMLFCTMVVPLRAAAEEPLDKPCAPCHFADAADGPKLNWTDYQSSVHAGETCLSCHEDIQDPDLHHETEEDDAAVVSCSDCHREQAEHYAGTVHGRSHTEEPGSLAASCKDCHGVHDIRRSSDVESSTHLLNLPETCAGCHAEETLVREYDIKEPHAYELYVRGAHAKPDEKNGRPVAASCSDCHGVHDIASSDEAMSTTYQSNIIDTCGSCHEEVKVDFARSVHGRDLTEAERKRLADRNLERPICTSCHSTHGITPPHDSQFRVELVHECGTCHATMLKTFEHSYHGEATTLGDATVAKCSDCHGSHLVLSQDDPDSSVHPGNKLETCRSCHEGAPEGFAGYYAHANYTDFENYPVLFVVYLAMIGLLVSVFSLFGLHTILWWIRGAIERRRARKLGLTIKKAHQSRKYIRRFGRYHRITHAFVIVSFLGLAGTGAPLKFSHSDWAKTIFSMLGGVANAGTLHRIFAIITFGYFAFHIAYIVRAYWRNRGKSLRKFFFGPNSPVPNLNDARDIAAHVRWFFGRGPKPTWDRFTYWEKFDYLAVFWGVAVIGLSGLFLWFPEFFSSFLPGWAVNVAFVIHSDEALLAMGFIFAVHFFNSHLRHDKFPLDPVIFTGVLTEEEFREERGREFERLEAEGRLDEFRAKAPGKAFVRAMYVLGLTAWLVGMTLLVLLVSVLW